MIRPVMFPESGTHSPQNSMPSTSSYYLFLQLRSLNRVISVKVSRTIDFQCNFSAINPSDGKWQGAFIEKISEQGYHIKFRKTGSKEIVPLFFLRESRAHPSMNSTSLKDENLPVSLEVDIPEHLKIKPNDNAEER